MYDALTVSKYVIGEFNRREEAITNLKLQKVLYYIQYAFLVGTGAPAYSNVVQAWRHGPVVPEVYQEYNHFVAEPIMQNNFDSAIIQECDRAIIDRVITETIDFDAWTLVGYTHLESTWKNNYSPNANREIPIEEIRKSESPLRYHVKAVPKISL